MCVRLVCVVVCLGMFVVMVEHQGLLCWQGKLRTSSSVAHPRLCQPSRLSPCIVSACLSTARHVLCGCMLSGVASCCSLLLRCWWCVWCAGGPIARRFFAPHPTVLQVRSRAPELGSTSRHLYPAHQPPEVMACGKQPTPWR